MNYGINEDPIETDHLFIDFLAFDTQGLGVSEQLIRKLAQGNSVSIRRLRNVLGDPLI